jgi:hypothetical protein
MNKEEEYLCLIGAYYGIKLMDEYDLKVYVLKDIDQEIKRFIKTNPIKDYDYEKEALKYQNNSSTKTKLQDSLIILNQINGPMELVFLIKARLRKLKKEE